MSSTKLKMLAGIFSIITITGSVVPTVTTFAAEKSSLSTNSTQASSTEKTYVLNENNANYQKAVEYLEKNASSTTVKYFKEYFYGKTVTPDNQEQLMDGYLEFLSTKPQGRVAMETILAVVASAIAIIQGLYSAGRYAAKQCVSRGILTKKSYKPNGGWIMAGITVSFGLPAALGFDDYMYDR